ncbi:Bug family tripartite tricarboxylate transporter substrate binding protein [Massilia cavernae]|uniref:Tripartite tricarboxylate transporter substrate binding protein n=1 Tax=Massilia cavernae TaxID=2320864 RepID=A0A418XFP7_9BURK|nr:tripartite tricarboxylate transporter substrate-binding protein [Massilia cavernae]RJG11278.1 tripartite tricarboxylate transporter substrate binding protein [Massilia cavernae]
MKSIGVIWQAAALWLACSAATAAPECIVPSKPAGAMDLTCKLVRAGWNASVQEDSQRMRISYVPGGVGAVAWTALAAQRRSAPDTLVAFSGGSLLNLAQGKFGKSGTGDVRWVAALGTDYGMVAVRADSSIHTLGDLVKALKKHPERFLIGMGGTIGGQDWIKMAMIARLGGVNPKSLRYVALEGGGEAFTAMQAGHVQVVSGDASEATMMAKAGGVRVLAVLSERRLPGSLANVPTAREQGFDVVWPIIRGVWMGQQVSDENYRKWVASFDRMMADPQFAKARAQYGLYPFALTGDALTAYVNSAVSAYGKQAAQLGLMR